jgi:hypothetical protein
MLKATNHFQQLSRGVLFLLFSFLMVCPCLADVSNPLSDTDWVLDVKAKARSKITGSQKTDGIGYLSFAADGTWYLLDEADLGMGGTYHFDSKGKLQMDMAAADIEDFFYDNLMDMMPYGLEQYLDELNVLSHGTKATFKQKNECMDLKFSLSFKILLVIHDQEGKVHKITVSYNIAASGNKCQQEGAIWQIEANCNYKLKKNKSSTPKTLQFYIGPLPQENLGDNEFRLYEVVGQNMELLAEGDFISKSGKIEFILDEYQMDTLILDMGRDIITEPIYDFFVIDYRPKLSAKRKGSDSFVCNWKCVFWVVLNTANGDSDPVGNFTLKGTGNRLL